MSFANLGAMYPGRRATSLYRVTQSIAYCEDPLSDHRIKVGPAQPVRLAGVQRFFQRSTKRIEQVDFNPGREYVIQWGLSAQRALAPSLTATIGYVGSHGVLGDPGPGLENLDFSFNKNTNVPRISGELQRVVPGRVFQHP
jgi:hypothetical protein